jgi:tetratricopeptide (TPR) repeat protein
MLHHLMKLRITCLLWLCCGMTFHQLTAQSTDEASPELSYTQTHFDSDTCCWRKLSHEKQYVDAANLIVSYIETNRSTANRHSLQWHAGQMYALAGDYALAKKYFKKTYSFFYKWVGNADARAWYYYAKGTVAFMDGDKKELEGIIRKWERQLPLDSNYKALIQLLDRWGQGYASYSCTGKTNRGLLLDEEKRKC